MFYFQLKFDNYQNTVLHINNVGVKRKSYRKYDAFLPFSLVTSTDQRKYSRPHGPGVTSYNDVGGNGVLVMN